MATDTTPTRIAEIDDELGDLMRRESMSWALVDRAIGEVFRCERRADELLGERAALLDDGR